MNQQAKRNTIRVILLALTSLIIIYFLFDKFVKIDNFYAVFEDASLKLIILVLIISMIGPILSALRWNFILKISGHGLTFARSLSVILSAWPLIFIPGRMGDFARSYPVRKKISFPITSGATLFEKIIDVIILLTLSGLGFFLIGNVIISTALLLSGIIILPIVFIVMPKFLNIVPDKISSKIKLIIYIFNFNVLKSRYFFFTLIMSALNWLVSIIMVWILFKAFGAQISVIIILAYLPLVIFAGLLPISISGLGTRDSAMVAFFISQSSAAQSLAVSLSYFFFGYLIFAIIGLPIFIKEFRK